MELKQLECFCKVAELGSFSLAAEALSLTQPTVSTHIHNLERSLSTKLFDRTGRKARLTPSGEVLYRYARQLLAIRDGALEALQSGEELRGELHIASSTIPGEYFLPAAIASFLEDTPQLKVRLTVTDSQGVIGMIQRGEADIGVVGMKGGSRLVFRPLFKDRVVLVATASHPLAGREVPWEELCRADLVTRERGSGTRTAFEKALRRMGFNPSQLRVVAELGSSSSVKESIKAGLGIGVISDMAVAEELGKDLKEVKLMGLGEVSRTFYLMTKKGRSPSPAVERFSRFVMSGGRWKG